VTIRANSPFKKYGTWSHRTINGHYSGNSFSRFYNRDYGINISYRFGSLKAQVKKTNTTIQNTDMVGGSSNSPPKDTPPPHKTPPQTPSQEPPL
ncbi:MAG: hypothetical protein PUI12_09680, partial [Bacteroidales bacterium]|nr:hypothetical protein [Bacteroidales bacterium]MDY5280349.1 hypothetical protein [Sodaliphilus sp.]